MKRRARPRLLRAPGPDEQTMPRYSFTRLITTVQNPPSTAASRDSLRTPGAVDEDTPTYLEDHWFSGPAVCEAMGESTTLHQTLPPETHLLSPAEDRHTAVPSWSKGACHRRRTLQRLLSFGASAFVLAALAVHLMTQQASPGLKVTRVSVSAGAHETLACGEHAVISGTVHTNGGAGLLTYRWIRNDGTTSGLRQENIPGGQTRVTLSLSWAFSGRGSYNAEAHLQVLSPGEVSSSASFAYQCNSPEDDNADSAASPGRGST
ncbi:hypothetical protein [Streptomyces sp. NPDC056480]|uniref:hypothetical protein n=1 Tax=Streptomyces sp. NPDC056480 TaxID=3345833 RepID=UPI0036B8693A